MWASIARQLREKENKNSKKNLIITFKKNYPLYYKLMEKKVIISNNELINNLRQIENEDYIAIDTEFIRDTTYFSKLLLDTSCLQKTQFYY